MGACVTAHPLSSEFAVTVDTTVELLYTTVNFMYFIQIDRKLYKRFLKHLREEDKKKIRRMATKVQ